MNALGNLKRSCHRHFPGGLPMFLVKQRLCKIKYSFEGSISNVDIGSTPALHISSPDFNLLQVPVHDLLLQSLIKVTASFEDVRCYVQRIYIDYAF